MRSELHSVNVTQVDSPSCSNHVRSICYRIDPYIALTWFAHLVRFFDISLMRIPQGLRIIEQTLLNEAALSCTLRSIS